MAPIITCHKNIGIQKIGFLSGKANKPEYISSIIRCAGQHAQRNVRALSGLGNTANIPAT
jgi:hypothetical protein